MGGGVRTGKFPLTFFLFFFALNALKSILASTCFFSGGVPPWVLSIFLAICSGILGFQASVGTFSTEKMVFFQKLLHWWSSIQKKKKKKSLCGGGGGGGGQPLNGKFH